MANSYGAALPVSGPVIYIELPITVHSSGDPWPNNAPFGPPSNGLINATILQLATKDTNKELSVRTDSYSGGICWSLSTQLPAPDLFSRSSV